MMLTAVQFVPAQTSLDSLGAEELFRRARDLAFNSRRDSARVLLKLALQKSPDYADIRILLARTYAWDGRRNEARAELKTVLEAKPKYLDAYLAAVDVEMWDDKLADALILCNAGLRFNPNSEELLVKRVKIYRDMNKDVEALFTLSILEDLNRSNPNIVPLRESIKTKTLLNSISVSYAYDWFTTTRYDPRHQYTLQYSRVTPYGSAMMKVNSSRRFGNTGYQLEVEAYPKIVSGIYAYTEYAYSWTKNYPKHRFGLEPFFKLPESFEASVGTRFLFFSSSRSISIPPLWDIITVITGSHFERMSRPVRSRFPVHYHLPFGNISAEMERMHSSKGEPDRRRTRIITSTHRGRISIC